MDLDNFIIGKTKEGRGEGRFGKKKPVVPKTKERGELLGFLLQKNKKSTGHRISRSSQSSQKKASTMGLKLKLLNQTPVVQIHHSNSIAILVDSTRSLETIETT